ncbi:MAG: CPBP family intramembrane metalloprotease [Bacteroidia bacterium]|nr:MAG: CPBP family intramembrane metalloprotease [Bacteroidia bacterium]
MEDKGMLGSLHPILKLLLLLLVMLVSALVVFVIGMLVALPFFGTAVFETMDPRSVDINLLRYVQILSHLGLFITAALVFAFLMNRRPIVYLQAMHIPKGKSLLISAAIMLVVVPLVFYLTQINQMLTLPESLQGIENWMRRTEDSAQEMTKLLLDVSTVQGLLFNIFMIAVIPAIGEEFIFRGAVQRIFRQWTGSIHVAVIVAAVLFSAMHMQFYGFLPRLLLGMVLGYMMVFTGNIWVPVFAHFFNNALAVTVFFLISGTDSDLDMDSLPEIPYAYIPAILSAILTLFLFRMLARKGNPGNSR